MKKDQAKRKRGNFDIVELFSIPSFSMFKVNYKKDKLAFYWNKTGRFELYIMDLLTKAIRQITDGELPKGIREGFIWGRDDRTIYFTKDVDGNEQHDIYSIDIDSKQIKQLTNTPNAQDIPLDTSPDGVWLLFTANRNQGQMNLHRLHLKTGDVEQITYHKNPVFYGKYSKDGSMIAYDMNEEKNLLNTDVYVVAPDGSKMKRLVHLKTGSNERFADWSEDGSFLVFTTDVHGMHQVATYHFSSEETTYYGDGKRSEYAVKIIGNEKILAISSNNASKSPLIYEVKSGRKKTLHFPPGVASGSEMIGPNKVIMRINRPLSPSTLVVYHLETEEQEILLKTDMGHIDPSLFVDGEHIMYPSKDGTMIPAIVYKPRDFDKNKQYPGIIIPHGGPTYHYALVFDPLAQYWADLGYLVMMPNVRGSTGYGAAFRDACINDWGGKDYEDWIAGRTWLIEEDCVDPKKVVIFGASYGGYATLWCMGNAPDLWAAGAAWVPVSDLLDMYAQSSEVYKHFLLQQMGDPVKDKERWIARSPLTHIQNMKSPLLLVHGTNDPRCPVSQSHLVVEKLKKYGFKENEDFEYVEFGDEGHGSSGDVSGMIRSFKLLDDFLYRKVEMNH